MRSPRADTELIPRSIDGVEIDVCPETDGVWFDPGELTKLADDPAYADRALRPSAPVSKDGLPCPRCRGGSLQPHQAGGVYLVHRCPSCAGVWVDGSVARAIVGRTQEDEINEIEREAEATNKSLLAEQGIDAGADLIENTLSDGLLGGLRSLLGRLF